MEKKLSALLEYVRAEGRICPLPEYWDRLWEMLPDKKPIGTGGWEPRQPLPLAKRQETHTLSKTLRLEEHIRYAAEHGALDEIDQFLRTLSNEQWFTFFS